MRVINDTGHTLTLRGVPGGIGWLCFAVVLGGAILTVTGLFINHLVRAGDSLGPVVMLGLGALLGLAFLVFGLVSLAVGRESLVLDRTTGKGDYQARSPIIDVPKPFSFDLAHVREVSLERRTELNPQSGTGPAASRVCRARLLIARPRRAITLDESSNGRDQRVRAVAAQVAQFLDLPMKETTPE